MAGGHDGGGGLRWLLTYADLITLLLALFILLYSTAKQDIEKFKQMSLAFKKAFNVPVYQGKDATALHGESSMQAPVLLDDVNFVSEKLARFVEGEGLSESITLGKNEDGLVISLSGSNFFEPASAELTSEGQDVLRRIGDIVAKLPSNIRVEGHTDNIPIDTRQFPSNWELSGARALAAMRYLGDEVKIPYGRLSFAGYGEFKPIADNDTREGRRRNRRVDIIALNSVPDQYVSPAGLIRPPVVAPGDVFRPVVAPGDVFRPVVPGSTESHNTESHDSDARSP